MELIRRQYNKFLMIFMVLLFAMCAGLFLWTIRSAERVHAAQTYEQIYNIKKAFLKDTVQNMIRSIDRFRDLNRAHTKGQIAHLERDMTRLYEISPAKFESLSLELLKREEYGESLLIELADSRSKTAIWRVGQGKTEGFSKTLRFGPYRIHLGVNEEWVDSQTKATIADIIHNQTFENDGYLWVNEVVNWNGGDGYAIRRIHANLRDTEGSLLSTKTTDVKGNLPYLTELEGIKKDGELYSNYFFKKKSTNEIAEKITYATLYKDYAWIVAMGMYLEDIQLYIDAAEKSSKDLTARLAILVLSLMVLFFVAALFILVRMEKWFLHTTSHAMRLESNTDPLTGALNRRMGNAYIEEAFRRFHRGLDNPSFFFFDIDNFKRVNDNFGHDAGDKVLKALVEQVRLNMRNVDHIFRWGGEEFLLMCYGVDRDGAVALAGKLNKLIAFTPIVIGKTDDKPTCAFDRETCSFIACEAKSRLEGHCVNREGEKIIHVTVSIGLSWFEKTDTAPEDVIKRCDDAMYRAKAEGKNCTRVG